MPSIMVIVGHPMNKNIAAQRWTAFANCPVNLGESLMRRVTAADAGHSSDVGRDIRTFVERGDLMAHNDIYTVRVTFFIKLSSFQRYNS